MPVVVSSEPLFRVLPRRVEQMHQVAAIVNDDVRLVVERFLKKHRVFFVRAAVPRVDRDAFGHERRRDGVLRRERIAPRHDDVGPAGL